MICLGHFVKFANLHQTLPFLCLLANIFAKCAKMCVHCPRQQHRLSMPPGKLGVNLILVQRSQKHSFCAAQIPFGGFSSAAGCVLNSFFVNELRGQTDKGAESVETWENNCPAEGDE